MKKHIKSIFTTTALGIILWACNSSDDTINSNIAQVGLEYAKTETVLKVPNDGEPEEPLLLDVAKISYYGGMESSYNVPVEVLSQEELEYYLTADSLWLGKDVEILPENLYSLDETVPVTRGNVCKLPLTIDYNQALLLDKTKTYISGVRILDGENIKVNQSRNLCLAKVTAEMYTPIPELDTKMSDTFIEGNNIAPKAIVETSSNLNSSYNGDNLIDGIIYTTKSRWISAKKSMPATVDFTFEEKHKISAINIYEDIQGADIIEFKSGSVQYWNGEQWVDIISFTDNVYQKMGISFNTFKTSKIRLYITAGGNDNLCRLCEVQIIGD